jgi:predicted RNase H-like HicB family nuclease
MNLETNVQVWREGSQYIAHALPIDVMSSAASIEAAKAALDEALRLFITTAEEAGTLDDLLEEAGYVREADRWVSPLVVATERRALAV